jgi:hypothetical protein
MQVLIKAARTLTVTVGILAIFMAMTIVAFRHSLLYWAMLSLAVLPAIAWRGLALGRSCLAAIVVAVSLAASPIDIWIGPLHTVQLSQPSLRVLPAMYGITCSEGVACYGCLRSFHDARHAVVICF